MKPEDLRSKNLVLVDWNNEIKGYNEYVPKFELTEIKEIRETVIMDIYNEFYDLKEDVKPIPITEEWLVHFEFINPHETYYELDILHGFTLLQGDKNGYIDVFEMSHDTLRVRYVHQLQNLYFALTEKELEINRRAKYE